MKTIIQQLTNSPKQLFLMDGLGAVLAAFGAGCILASFETYFGMPKSVLYPFTAIACLYALYSLSCYFRLKQNWKPYLLAIIIANIVLLAGIIGFVSYHAQSLTSLGWTYYTLEIIVTIAVIVIEIIGLSKLAPNQ